MKIKKEIRLKKNINLDRVEKGCSFFFFCVKLTNRQYLPVKDGI